MEQLYASLRPSLLEEEEMQQSIQSIVRLLSFALPQGSEIELFGSRAYNLHLKDSDVDIRVNMDRICGEIPRPIKVLLLRHLANQILDLKAGSGVRVIEGARVPVLTFKEAISGTNFDIVIGHATTCPNYLEPLFVPPPEIYRRLVVLSKYVMMRKGTYKVSQGGAGGTRLYALLVVFCQGLESSLVPFSLQDLDSIWDMFVHFASQPDNWDLKEGTIWIRTGTNPFPVVIYKSTYRQRKNWARTFAQ